ncbi:N-acetylneuraminate synthase [Chitinimonas taiwanensis]|uniref:N-acetylneuraminate synthase n=1 Tax=Chitinimonas taiwanensis DSM 18899 TaxID=1121279 RepID=A0A1K2HQ40_9NEIS|nr:N-acetylneuraminate synthase [Chitinimonas taiwanensis]SFZ78878.1 N-acetylneuraminate synthase [Chitinimonas taiwanensis DSM 18899]
MSNIFFIAEAGVNHNGSEELALQLVETAAKCGADAVKFQTFTADKLVRKGAEKAAYQKAATGDGDQYSMLKQLEMSPDLHKTLIKRCAELNIEFMSTPFDEDAADFLLSLGMRRIKVPSGEITNTPFLRFLAAKNVPLIVSSGMATLAEVEQAVAVIAQERTACGLDKPLGDVLTLLHCTSNYPASPVDVNLLAMRTMAHATGLPVGYSDHTLGLAVSTAAVALGATVIEKHFTLDKGLPGPDHPASLDPIELAELVAQVRAAEQALGSAIKAPVPSELPVRELVRRSVCLAKDVEAGMPLTSKDLCLLRPGTGIAPKDFDAVIGRSLVRSMSAGSALAWADLVVP